MTDELEPACAACNDSGWLQRECAGDRVCGRRRRHLPHEFVRPCPCRPMNENYQLKLERTRRAA